MSDEDIRDLTRVAARTQITLNALELAVHQMLSDRFGATPDAKAAHREFTDRLHSRVDGFGSPGDPNLERGLSNLHAAIDRLMKGVETAR